MFLEFGNVTAAAFSVIVLLLVGVVVNQLLLWMGRVALSTDNENSPIKLDKNWLLNKIVRFLPKTDNIKRSGEHYLLMANLDKCYSLDSEDTWRYNGIYAERHCLTKDKDLLKAHSGYREWHTPFFTLFCILGATLAIDITILFLQSFFLVTATILGFLGTILALRLTTNFLWNNMAKTEDNTKRIEKLEEKSDA